MSWKIIQVFLDNKIKFTLCLPTLMLNLISTMKIKEIRWDDVSVRAYFQDNKFYNPFEDSLFSLIYSMQRKTLLA